MAIGKVAPDIRMADQKLTLSQIKNRYKLVVFGSSWCPQCAKEVPGLAQYYGDWHKERDLEIILVSLDTNPAAYKKFITDFPWISVCDFGGWESKIARDYFVMGTPTMYLLDRENKILLKPVSAAHIDAWLKVPGRI